MTGVKFLNNQLKLKYIRENMKNTLYVGNLSFDSSDEDLREHFAQSVTVEEVKVVYDRDSGRSRGFAFVTVGDAEQVAKAVELFNEQDFLGRKLVVREAYDSNERGGGGGGGQRRGGGGDQRRGGYEKRR